MYRVVTITILSLMMVSCGGGGGGSTDNNNPPAPPKVTKGKVELGPISGGNVVIKSLDGYELATYTTDRKGDYEIDIEELKNSINNYNSSLKLVRITSYGGVDTDVNDDGTHIQKLVQGDVSGIIPVEKLLGNKTQNINLISTVIDKILKGTLNITEEQIIKIAKELGVSDINNDGNITIDDIIYYQMGKNESVAEDELRSNFLATIHENNTTKQDEIIDNIKYEFSTITPYIKIENSFASIAFDAYTNGNYIQYGIKNSNEDVKFQQYYTGELISIYQNDVLFFQECNLVYGCSKIQKVYFDGQKTFLDYLEVPKLDILDKVKEYETKKKQLEDEIKALEAQRGN